MGQIFPFFPILNESWRNSLTGKRKKNPQFWKITPFKKGVGRRPPRDRSLNEHLAVLKKKPAADP
jgi:hypothetical protein